MQIQLHTGAQSSPQEAKRVLGSLKHGSTKSGRSNTRSDGHQVAHLQNFLAQNTAKNKFIDSQGGYTLKKNTPPKPTVFQKSLQHVFKLLHS